LNLAKWAPAPLIVQLSNHLEKQRGDLEELAWSLPLSSEAVELRGQKTAGLPFVFSSRIRDRAEVPTMNSIETLATFFGWCVVINIGFILIAVVLAAAFHEGFGKINAKIFGISQEEAKATVFRAFQQYRFAVLVLNLVPYIALKIMS
jgi:hypothetical protein